MSEKTPRAPWLRLVENTESVAGTGSSGEQKKRTPFRPVFVENAEGRSEDGSQTIEQGPVTPAILVQKWIEVTSETPADWSASIRPVLLAKARDLVKSYDVTQLHLALSSPNIWSRPSFVLAVTDEVRERMRSNNFEPRE